MERSSRELLLAVCQALGIDLGLDGEDLTSSNLLSIASPSRRPPRATIVAAPRVGIAYAEFCFFALYALILLVVISAVLYAYNVQSRFVQYGDNLIPKLL